MAYEIIIENYGCGNAIVVRQRGEIIDYFVDPPKHGVSFYPPRTFMWATVQRRIKRNGGYFIKVPNGNEGFLISKKTYGEGTHVKVMSQVFHDKEKPQRFIDQLKIVSRSSHK